MRALPLHRYVLLSLAATCLLAATACDEAASDEEDIVRLDADAIDPGDQSQSDLGGDAPGDATENDTSDTAPDASDTAPDASDTAPDASDVQVDASDTAPDASDASDMTDTGDPCAALPDRCATPGPSCDGNVLVECASDGNGCLVETRTDCALSGATCDASGAAPQCVVACTDACPAAATTCDGSALERCADTDADGCLELTVLDCALSGEVCDDSASPPACVPNGSGDGCQDAIVVQGAGGRWTGSNFAADFTHQHNFDAGTNCAPTVDGARQEAVFAVALAAGESVRVSEHGALDSIRRILGSCADGAACLASPDDPDSRYALYSATTDETVFVVVEARGNAFGRGYDIQIEIIAPNCGDGFLSPGEVCDDTNTSDGDGCAADCSAVESGYACYPGLCVTTGAGDTCQDAIALSGSSTVSLQTTGYADDYTTYSGCNVGGGLGPDVVFSIELQPNETLAVETLADDFNLALVLADVCPSLTASCLDYDSDFGQAGVDVDYFNDTGAPKTLFLVADAAHSNSPTDGTFTLGVELRPLVCGDGFVDGPEACDDGNGQSGDGCSATCTVEGEVCPDAIALSGSATVLASTTGYVNDYSYYGGACGGLQGLGPDVVYRIDVPAGDYLEASMVFDNARETLALVTDCANINGTCLAGDNTLPDPRVAGWLNTTGQTQTVYIIADGVEAGSAGPFRLDVELGTSLCGDGVVLGEACDDGNTSSGDGCSAGCAVEQGYDCFAEPSFCYPQGDGDTCAASDVLTLPGPGTYGGDTDPWVYDDDYGNYAAAGCPGQVFNGFGVGNDMAFALSVGAGQTLTATVVPTGTADLGVVVVGATSQACTTLDATTCLGGTDVGPGGVPETVSWSNTANAAQQVYILVDGYNGSEGAFTLEVALQ